MNVDRSRGLSPREVEVLQGLADGLTRRQIGARLGIAELTVKTHLERIKEAAGFDGSNAAGLVGWGFRNGVVT